MEGKTAQMDPASNFIHGKAVVTVVIPVYNRLNYLAETINSVIDQLYANWQILVIDDGSQEDVQQFLQRFNDPRIDYFRQENMGNAAARNSGIQRTQSDYVICLDSDDIWQPEMLKDTVDILDEQPDIDVVFTQMIRIDAMGNISPHRPGPQPFQSDILDALLMGYPILPSSTLVRRSCFERWGVFTEGLDDWDLWLRWASQGCKFYCIERPLLKYRIHNQNLNLALAVRRELHLTILNRFYNSGSPPQRAVAIKDKVYANQHFKFAEKAWRGDDSAAGIEQFKLAVARNPDYLENEEFFYKLGCAHQPRLDSGTKQNYDPDAANKTLTTCLDGLYSAANRSDTIQKKRNAAYAYANLVLGKQAIRLMGDKTRANHLLRKSFQAWPLIVIRSDWVKWQLSLLFKQAPKLHSD